MASFGPQPEASMQPNRPSAGSRAIFGGETFFLIEVQVLGCLINYTFEGAISHAHNNQLTLLGLNAGAHGPSDRKSVV